MHQDGRIGRSIAATIFLVILIGYLTLGSILNPDVQGTDKSHHLLAFVALAFPLLFLRPRIAPFVALLAAAFGGAAEVVQPLNEKKRELLDFRADMEIGILVGAAWWGFVYSASGGSKPQLVIQMVINRILSAILRCIIKDCSGPGFRRPCHPHFTGGGR